MASFRCSTENLAHWTHHSLTLANNLLCYLGLFISETMLFSLHYHRLFEAAIFGNSLGFGITLFQAIFRTQRYLPPVVITDVFNPKGRFNCFWISDKSVSRQILIWLYCLRAIGIKPTNNTFSEWLVVIRKWFQYFMIVGVSIAVSYSDETASWNSSQVNRLVFHLWVRTTIGTLKYFKQYNFHAWW